MRANKGLTFGIYAASQVGTSIGAPDDVAAIDTLVTALQSGKPFAVREYLHYLGAEPEPERVAVVDPERELRGLTMPDEWYVDQRRQLDLVLSYLPTSADIPGWLAFIDRAIHRYGAITRFLQITLEPNFPIPWIDGSSPAVLDALTHGMAHARRALNRLGHTHVELGFSVAEPPEWLGGDTDFWQHLSKIPAADFADHVDYVGLALYPDAFSPVAPAGTPGNLIELTERAIRHLRETSLPTAHLDFAPLHIAENGSPTGPDRSPRHQADSLEQMLETIIDAAPVHNITHYELFGLRDADSAAPEPTNQLGITTDDYRPKPAFTLYQTLIDEHSLP
ncbi:hypothetical protein [Nocardia sp. NBC_01009]|uniref:hypothetical protein n=1 Tax=Nocardia sp. NBC_01009 TaxID=2975996 RepID=UPI0038637F20|nr:hypothetical protein OHA42_28075 [Nocardia sp. NBC_01009]